MTWDRNSAAYVGISEEELEECVSNKLNKPRPQQITENWLLIVSGTTMSQQIGLTHCKKFNDFFLVQQLFEDKSF